MPATWHVPKADGGSHVFALGSIVVYKDTHPSAVKLEERAVGPALMASFGKCVGKTCDP